MPSTGIGRSAGCDEGLPSLSGDVQVVPAAGSTGALGGRAVDVYLTAR